jgi:excinuclease ABC subunit A
MIESTITIRGAAEHNLRQVDLDLPARQLVVFSGVSGSGKSSLAFDTIYAEARRRYLLALEGEGTSLVQGLKTPRVAHIDGLAPAVAIDQGRGRQNPRSTVSSLSGIHDYLRLLFARLGQPHCLVCGASVGSQRFEEVYETALGLPEGTKLTVLAPRRLQQGQDAAKMLEEIDRTGYRRLRVDGTLYLVEGLEPQQIQSGRLEIVVDRLVVKAETRRRLKGSLEAALETGDGQLVLWLADGEEKRFSVRPSCSQCAVPFEPVTPALFSFNTPQGACPECRGLGVERGLAFSQVFADGRATYGEALGLLWSEYGHQDLRKKIEAFCKQYGVDAELAVGDWGEEIKERFWQGTNRRGSFIGVYRWLERLAGKASGEEGAWFEERLGDAPCRICQGQRLRPEALAVEVDGVYLGTLSRLSVEAASACLRQMTFAEAQAEMARAILEPVGRILEVLLDLGLGYLALERPADSLSSGEFQRLRLGAVLGLGMSEMLYVLDEPTMGLHARDSLRLLGALKTLRDGGNSVLVVEHDATLIGAADYLVDLGPGAGEQGGQVVAVGTPAMVQAAGGMTGDYLAGRWRLAASRLRPVGAGGWLKVEGASGHNLQDIDVALPLGTLVCVTGVSGSGKSSFVDDTLYRLLAAHLQHGERAPLPYKTCMGIDALERVVAVDQKPIGRTPRSNAATYTGLLQGIRRLFTELPESRVRGYKPAHFSFNAVEGACPGCKGSGMGAAQRGVFEDLQSLCAECGGRRYKDEVLEIRYRERSIAEILEFSVAEATLFFDAIPDLARRLRLMQEVGLGYLRLGQPATRLSGGEAQRVKLATELGRPQQRHTLYILDEPTTGLHLEDVRYLLELLQRLVDEDNSVVVVEHHIEFIAAVDYVIDLGPEGGAGGGRVVATGTPEQVAQVEGSWTGHYLQRYFNRS